MTTLKMPKVDRKIIKNRDNIIKDICNFTKRRNVLAMLQMPIEEIQKQKYYSSMYLGALIVKQLNPNGILLRAKIQEE